MRVMVLVKGNEESESGQLPDESLFRAMGEYNEQLAKAGVMLAADGLHPSSRGKRVRFGDGGSTVIDGPFAESKELVAGFWIWQVSSIDEAVEWLRRAPFQAGEVELRPIAEIEDFEGTLSPDVIESERALREQISGG
jgi:hypothetical protein